MSMQKYRRQTDDSRALEGTTRSADADSGSVCLSSEGAEPRTRALNTMLLCLALAHAFGCAPSGEAVGPGESGPKATSLAATGAAVRRSASGRWLYDPNRGKNLFLGGAYTYGGDYSPGQDHFWCSPNTSSQGLAADNSVADQYNFNFIRFWVQDSPNNGDPSCPVATPMQFSRSSKCCAADGGNLFDLDTLDDAYFAKVRSSIESLPPSRYASVMLFAGAADFWPYSPYNAANNIQGAGAAYDTVHKRVDQGNDPYIRSRQTAYVQRLASELSGYSNIVYEVANEDGYGSLDWQMDIASDLRAADTGNPHLVGITVVYPNPDNAALMGTNADWFAPFAFHDSEPSTADGSKMAILDSDHGGSPDSGRPSVADVWQYFTRGYNLSILPFHLGSASEVTTFNALGRAAYLANSRIADLDAMTPQDGGGFPSSTGYSLYNTGVEYLVYQSGSDDVSVSLPAGSYDYEWYAADGDGPASPTPVESGTVSSDGGSRSFARPAAASVLYITAGGGSSSSSSSSGGGCGDGGGGYLGCYRDSLDRDLPNLLIVGSVTTKGCIDACNAAGYAYAGTQYSYECWCGDSYGGQGLASNCDMPCSGDGSEICGGSWANSVYQAR